MNSSSAQSLPALLNKYNLRPRKGLGQNFLTDPFHLRKIVEAAELTAEDIVLEIGPGPGALTRLLAESARRVVTVEVDPNMVNLLKNEFCDVQNLTIIEGDILQIQLDTLQLTNQPPTRWSKPPDPPSPSPQSLAHALRPPGRAGVSVSNRDASAFKVVANLPYYITSAVLRHLLESAARPERIVVTVQQEVAQRIVAEPGKMSVLAVSVQFYGKPTIVHRIPAGAFYPPPKVDSAVVRIDTFLQPPVAVTDTDHFFRIVKAGFGQKRKQLKNSLTAGLKIPVLAVITALEQATIDPTRRAESLSLVEWGQLAEALRL